MTSVSQDTKERIPVWNALSELFLDTEMTPDDRERIAKILAASRYSEKKLEEILRFEVTPVLKGNLRSVAGEWAGFDEAWMREQMTPLIDKRPSDHFGSFLMIRRDWSMILSRVVALRSR